LSFSKSEFHSWIMEFLVYWLVKNFIIVRYIHCAVNLQSVTSYKMLSFSVSLIFTCVIILKQLSPLGSVNSDEYLPQLCLGKRIHQYSLRLRQTIVSYSYILDLFTRCPLQSVSIPRWLWHSTKICRSKFLIRLNFLNTFSFSRHEILYFPISNSIKDND
jgi:hypothetical protein